MDFMLAAELKPNARECSVGIGRPFLYAYSAYGQSGTFRRHLILYCSLTERPHECLGVEKALQILAVSFWPLFTFRMCSLSPLQDEFGMNLRLLGARDLSEVVPEMVDTRSLTYHTTSVPEDRMYGTNCENLNGLSSV